MAKSFADFEAGAPRKNSRNCPRCGAEAKAGNVSVRLAEYNGDASHYTQLSSRTVAMCEECCVEVFDVMKDTLEGEAFPQQPTAKAKTKTNGTSGRRRRTRV